MNDIKTEQKVATIVQNTSVKNLVKFLLDETTFRF